MKVKKLLLGFVVLVGGLVLVEGARGLTYQREVDLYFGFEPTLSVSLTGDLIINGLVPGTADYSNTINIAVNTNNATGYTMTARVGDGTNYTNARLVDENDASNYFSSPRNDDWQTLSNFGNDEWRYSTAATINTGTTTFGRLAYGTETSINCTTDTEGTACALFRPVPPGGNTTSFTIGAKATASKPAGNYNNVIIFTVLAKAVPKTISSMVYMQDFAGLSSDEKTSVLNSMTTGEAYRLMDNRDNKYYYVTKQADGKVWMSQNLDLCIGCSGTAALTSKNTDLNNIGTTLYPMLTGGYTKSVVDNTITWNPSSTATTSGRVIGGDGTVSGWSNSASASYSAEGGEVYLYTSGNNNDDIVYNSLDACEAAGHSEVQCASGHVGNYYNWTVAVASNVSGSFDTNYAVAGNSICPAGWRLPKGASDSDDTSGTSHEFGGLYKAAGVVDAVNSTVYKAGRVGGFVVLRQNPLYFVRGGNISGTSLSERASHGYYWSSTVASSSKAYATRFRDTSGGMVVSDTPISAAGVAMGGFERGIGYPVRCIVK